MNTMKFDNAYPTTDSFLDPSLHYFNRYGSDSLNSLYSIPTPSRSYTDHDHEEPETGVLEAITVDLVPGSLNALDRFLSGKRRFAAKSVEEMLGLIYERERIRYDHSRRIDYESAQSGTLLLEIGAWQIGLNPQIDKTRSQIQGDILNLERERRMEEVACWRDITRLKGDLREALRDFDQEKRKERLITSQDGST